MKPRGFTLIELLVVIAIIGLLSSVVLASLNTARAKGRDALRVATLHSVADALELYYNDYGAYPVSNCISSTWWTCWGSGGEARFLPATYISTMSQDPSFNDDGHACDTGDQGSRLYGYWSDGQRYFLGTHLENPPSSSSGNYWNGTASWGCISGSANYAIRNGV